MSIKACSKVITSLTLHYFKWLNTLRSANVGQCYSGGLRNETGPSVMQTSLMVLLYQRVIDHSVDLSAMYIPGKRNVVANKLSRQCQVLGTEWSLHQEIVDRFFHLWGRPMIDLFASWFNRELEVYCSAVPDSFTFTTAEAALRQSGSLCLFSRLPAPSGLEQSNDFPES